MQLRKYIHGQTIGKGRLEETLLTGHAPYRPLYELGNYYILGRILYYVPQHSPMHPGRVLTTFAAISGIVEVGDCLNWLLPFI